MRIVITGTPGTGKSAIAELLGKALKNPVIHVNALIKSQKLYSKMQRGETIADLGRLQRKLKALMKPKNIIVESHLLCEFPLPADLVIVFRCKPAELEKRLKKRGYSGEKTNENVLSEILDYCLIKAERNYGGKRALQIDATKKLSAKTVLQKIGKFKKRGETDNRRWLAGMAPAELKKWIA